MPSATTMARNVLFNMSVPKYKIEPAQLLESNLRRYHKVGKCIYAYLVKIFCTPHDTLCVRPPSKNTPRLQRFHLCNHSCRLILKPSPLLLIVRCRVLASQILEVQVA